MAKKLKILRYGFPDDDESDLPYDDLWKNATVLKKNMLNILDINYCFEFMCYCRGQEDEYDLESGTFSFTICRTRRDDNFEIKSKTMYKLFTKVKDYTQKKQLFYADNFKDFLKIYLETI